MTTDALITLKSGRVERYAVDDLPHLRKNLGGFGYSYLNSRTGKYEQARKIEPVTDELSKRIETLSASVSARKKHNKEEPSTKLPAHLRNHRIYGL